jgi:hypothetical protein
MAGLQPSNVQIATSNNWISSSSAYNMLMPQNNPDVIKAFGNQDVTGMLDMVGGGKHPVPGLTFRHFEEDRLNAVVYATGTAGASGAAVVYTLSNSTITSYPATYDPYIAAAAGTAAPNAGGTTTLNPVRVNQTVEFSTGIKGTVTARTTTTFTVAPDKIGASYVCPTQTGAEPIRLGGIVNGEGGDQPDPMNFRLNVITGVMEILAETASSTGSALGEQTWTDFDDGNGTTGKVWFFKNQNDSRKQILNQREISFVTGEEVDNTSALATYDATLLKTKGLFSFAQSYNGTTNYNITPGVTLSDFEDMIIDQIDKNKGSMEYSGWCSIRLRQSIDAFIRPEMQAGAVVYGMFGGGKDQYVNFGFSGFEHLGYTFHLKTYNLLNNPSYLGNTTKYQNMGVFIPMDYGSAREGTNMEKIETPALRMNYVKNGEYDREFREWLIGSNGPVNNTTLDKLDINYRTHFGFQGFRPNAYAFLQGS